MADVEPWLRGALSGVHPSVMPVFFSFLQVREDLGKHTEGLMPEQVWRPVAGNTLGFHLKHIAGSVDRLSTYLSGAQLSDRQLEALRGEHVPDAALPTLLAAVDESLSRAEDVLREVDPERLHEERFVGRQRLRATVLGLLVHLAEHTQRHLGQAIVYAKIVRSS